MEDVQKSADTCAASIKVSCWLSCNQTQPCVLSVLCNNTDFTKFPQQDYELQLASYSSGLETLLNVPIKRTMLQSPASVVRQEVGVILIQFLFILQLKTI